MESGYKIVFAGQVVDGFDVDQAKANMRKLFKADDAKVEALFSGKRVVIKKNLDEATALKYQRNLQKAGIECSVESVQPAPPPVEEKPPEPEHQPISDVSITDGAPGGPRGLTLAEPGAMLQDDYARPSEPDADLSGITLAPPGADILEQHDQPSRFEADVDDIGLAPPGADILDEKQSTPPLQVDLGELTLAPPGADIGPGGKKDLPPPPDTEGIKLEE